MTKKSGSAVRTRSGTRRTTTKGERGNRKSLTALKADLDRMIERMQTPENVAVGKSLFEMSEGDLRKTFKTGPKAHRPEQRCND